MKSLSEYILERFTVAGTVSSKILLFDIDDTLLHNDIFIYVIKDGKRIKKLSSTDFNSYKLKDGEEFDYSEFSSEKLLDKSTFLPYWETLKREYKKGTHIGIITARENGDMFHRFFMKHGIDIKPALIFAINEPSSKFSGSFEERKAQAIEQLIKWGYRTFVFFDDNEANLNQAKKLERNNDILIHTVKV